MDSEGILYAWSVFPFELPHFLYQLIFSYQKALLPLAA